MKIALVQRAPMFLDLQRALAATVAEICDAAARGAGLIVFPEAWLPGYPAWIWRLRPGTDHVACTELHTRLAANAVSLHGDALRPLQDVAARCAVTVVCGLTERASTGTRTTLYNTVVVIGPDGTLLNRHRKLMPTNVERTIWGAGDAAGLRGVDIPTTRLGTLICWEVMLPQVRLALYADGIDCLVVPTYDSGDASVESMKHVARESGCWVMACGNAFMAQHLPGELAGNTGCYPDPLEWVNAGDSVIVAPNGRIVAGPLRCAEGHVEADIDRASIVAARRSLDVAGHTARPDLITLHVDRRPREAVTFTD